MLYQSHADTSTLLNHEVLYYMGSAYKTAKKNLTFS